MAQEPGPMRHHLKSKSKTQSRNRKLLVPFRALTNRAVDPQALEPMSSFHIKQKGFEEGSPEKLEKNNSKTTKGGLQKGCVFKKP